MQYCNLITAAILLLLFWARSLLCEDGNAHVKQLFQAGDVCDSPEGSWVPLPEGVKCGKSDCKWPSQWCVIGKGDGSPSFKCVDIPEPCKQKLGVSDEAAPPSPPPPKEDSDNSATEGSGGTDEPSCEDAHELCCLWAINGECDKNMYYMRVACQKSCGTCGCSIDKADSCEVKVNAGDCQAVGGGGDSMNGGGCNQGGQCGNMLGQGVQMQQGGCQQMGGCGGGGGGGQQPPPCGNQMGGGCGQDKQQWQPPCQTGIFPAQGGGCGANQYGGRGGCSNGGCKPVQQPKPMGCQGGSCGSKTAPVATGPAPGPTFPRKECGNLMPKCNTVSQNQCQQSQMMSSMCPQSCGQCR